MMTDIHSHALPFVDDGSESKEDSVAMLKEEEAQGVTSVICTPHYSSPFLKEKAELSERVEEFNAFAKEKGVKANLFLGQEIYVTDRTLPLLKEDRLLTMNGTKYVLAEFSTTHRSDVTEAVYMLKLKGYTPIVAHIERYSYLTVVDAKEIKSLGGLIQVNAASVMGKPKAEYKKRVKKLIKAGLVDFVASDVHFVRKNRMKEAYGYIKRKFGEETAEKLFVSNAKKLTE
ncbi:MAG: hypothetical protein J6W87_01160 [Clostridia bacterium]|nr:hypothetical protein [Clostridia bacterium]